MKKGLCVCLVGITIASKAAIITWDGEAGDGLWSNAVNWSANVLPLATDDVLLDNSFLVTGYAVILPAGAITTTLHSLVISPAGAVMITLILPASNTADPGLLVTGPADALILNDRAVLKNSSGASVGTGIVVTNTFRINNGGRYIHNTSRGNAAIVSQLSAAAGTESGVFEYDVPVASYVVSLTGRIYGSLILSAIANNGTVSYIGSGASALHVNGDLQINTGVNFRINMTADFIVHHNLIQAAASIFDVQTANGNNFIKVQGDLSIGGKMTESGNGLPVLELNGSVNQYISITDSLINRIGLKINNPAGVTLVTPVTLPYNLQLANGKIRTDITNILTMTDNMTYTGGSTVSFVEGPMKKTGDDDFTFPVGKGAIYAPVTLAGGNGASVTDQFIAEYLRANPQSSYGVNYETATPPAAIDHISYVEYWKVSSNTGTGVSKLITLKVNCESFCREFTSLLIGRYDNAGAQWKSVAQSAVTALPSSCPGYLAGTITGGPVNTFTQFTLASSAVYAVNPLPVQLILFNVKKNNDVRASITWEMAAPCSSAVRFDVERAGEDRHFRSIATRQGNERESLYTIEDAGFQKGNSYYRLKMTDEQGLVSYSRIVVIHNGMRDLSLLSLSSVQPSSKLILSVVSLRSQALELLIADMGGRIVERKYQRLSVGTTAITLFLDNFPPGIYQLCGFSSEGQTNTLRFFKE